MALSAPERQDRFRGALLGLGIGDALGFGLRGVPASSLRRLTSLGEDFSPRPRGRFAQGQFSDDTQLMLAVAQSVISEGRLEGRAAAAHLAWAWREGVLLHPPHSVVAAAQRLVEGIPWMASGAPPGVVDASCLSRGLVVGLLQPEPLSLLPHDAAVVTVCTHKDPLCAAAVAAYARAVSLGLEGEPRSPAAFCEALALAAAAHDASLAEELRALPRVLTWEPERALSLLCRVGLATQPGGGELLPSHPVPVLLTALYAALTHQGDAGSSFGAVLQLGGEVDACAALVGGLLGAHLGQSGLPARLRAKLLYGPEIAATADALFLKASVAPAVARARARAPR